MLDKKACRESAAPGTAMSPDNGLLHAEQVQYIVQTAVKIIDHKKTLVLYVHKREHAAQGDFLPAWTMFHCRDGYITLARTEDGRTSWRTASFDNLGETWHFEKECAFYSSRDQERLERYFHDGRHKGFASLVQAQSAMKRHRLEKRLRGRRQKIQDRMVCIPVLPCDWKVWVRRTALPDYFFYDYRKGNQPVTGVCSSCGRKITVPKAKNDLKTVCPHCGRELTMRSGNRRKHINDRDTCQIIQRTAPDEIVIRVIKAMRRFDGDSPQESVYENARLFIRFRQDESGSVATLRDEFHYSRREARWKPGRRPAYFPYSYGYEGDINGYVYCKNLPETFRDTPWQYRPLAAFYGHLRKPMAVIPFLAAYLKQPRLEHLVKRNNQQRLNPLKTLGFQESEFLMLINKNFAAFQKFRPFLRYPQEYQRSVSRLGTPLKKRSKNLLPPASALTKTFVIPARQFHQRFFKNILLSWA